MNKLALTAILVGGLLQTSGCIITTDDDPSEGGLLEVSWPVEACNSTTATVYTMNTATQEMFMDAYPCSAGGTGSSSPLLLPLGNWDVWVQIQNDAMTRAHATSNATNVDFFLDGDVALVSTNPVANEQGNFEFEWTLADGGGAALTCTAAGADGARFLTTLANTTQGDAHVYDCDTFYGKSAGIDAGLYTVVVELIDASDAVLGNFDAFEETVIGNYTIHLGIFDFTIGT